MIGSAGKRRGVVLVVCFGTVMTLSAAAAAAWTTSGAGAGAARSTAMPGAAAAPSVAVSGTTVQLNFPVVTTVAGTGAATSYTINRYTVATGGAAVQTACTRQATQPNCTDSPGSGTFYYSFTPRLGTNWVGTESLRSGAATVTVTGVAITLADGNNGNTNLSFAGTGTNGGSVTVSVCKVATFPCTGGNVVGSVNSTSTVAGGAWTTGNMSGLVAGTDYYALAVQSTPSATSAVVGPFQARNGDYSF